MKKNLFSILGLLTLTFALQARVAVARDCGEVPTWLKVSDVKFRVVKPTEVYDVKVTIPDISKLKCTSSHFEYGTDYYFELKDSEPVKLRYFEKDGDKEKRSTKMTGYLNAHTVFLGDERKKTPHYLEVTDDELEVTYYIYLSEKDGPAYARLKGSDQKFKIVKPKKE